MSTAQVALPMNCLFEHKGAIGDKLTMMNSSNDGNSSNGNNKPNSNSTNNNPDIYAHPFLRFASQVHASQASKKKEESKQSASPTKPAAAQLLPPSFIPGPMDGKYLTVSYLLYLKQYFDTHIYEFYSCLLLELTVICHRGKGAFNHSGNKRYRGIIEATVHKYSQVKSRIQKSIIVADIVESIRSASPHGGFVKPHGKNRWVQVSDDVAHGKVGQSFRDLLSEKYKSSTAAKKRRRKEVNAKIGDDFDAIVQSNKGISKKLKRVSNELHLMGPDASEDNISKLFDTANCDLLEFLKRSATPPPTPGKITSGGGPATAKPAQQPTDMSASSDEDSL